MKKFLDICQACLVLFGLMICGLFLASLVVLIPVEAQGGLVRQWLMFSAQNVFAFILPAVLAWKLCFKGNSLSDIGALSLPSARMIGIALAAYFISMPALNQIVFWNENVVFPDALASFEKWCQETEARAAAESKILLSVDAFWQMAVNVLVIGVLTGIGEEFFFRGGLQKLLARCGVSPHVAIWVAAFIFSALHMQFYGFIPRMLLGAWFGYLYRWSGNIWVSSFAHALNNSIAVLVSWLIHRNFLSDDFDSMGVADGSFPFAFLCSVILVGIFLFTCHRQGWLTPRSSDRIHQH